MVETQVAVCHYYFVFPIIFTGHHDFPNNNPLHLILVEGGSPPVMLGYKNPSS